MTVNKFTVSSIKKPLQTVFSKNTEIQFAYLFGSHAINKPSPLSDIDLAIFVKNSNLFTFNNKLALHADCCRVLKTNEVDLIILNQTTNLILQDEIIRHGKLIYLKNKNAYDNYELKTLHKVCDFKWQRQLEIEI